MKYKYVAVNDLTGIQIKAFRTKYFAVRWMRRPFKILGTKFFKPDIYINLYPVIK